MAQNDDQEQATKTKKKHSKKQLNVYTLECVVKIRAFSQRGQGRCASFLCFAEFHASVNFGRRPALLSQNLSLKPFCSPFEREFLENAPFYRQVCPLVPTNTWYPFFIDIRP